MLVEKQKRKNIAGVEGWHWWVNSACLPPHCSWLHTLSFPPPYTGFLLALWFKILPPSGSWGVIRGPPNGWGVYLFFPPTRNQRPELSSVQFSLAQSVSTPWTVAPQASLSIANSWILLKLMFIESVMPSNHLILCHPLVLQPSIFPNIRVFSKESVLRMRWLKYWSFSFSISPSKPYSGLISARSDRFDLLAVQGTLKSFLQHHSSKASILWCSAFFSPTLTSVHDYWKNHSFD